MPLSAIDLCRKVLPMTNCAECGVPTCLAFATKVIQEKRPLVECPYVEADKVAQVQPELDAQHEAGVLLKRDLREDALAWARQRAASMAIEDMPARIGGQVEERDGQSVLVLPYFDKEILITSEAIRWPDGTELDHFEQVFILNHMAQGGSSDPVGRWRALEQIPNTVSKIKSMQDHVDAPLQARFAGKLDELAKAAQAMGGVVPENGETSADAIWLFRPLPKVPLLLTFHDAEPGEGFGARAKVVFDETITEHLDIESMIFLCERLVELLGAKPG